MEFVYYPEGKSQEAVLEMRQMSSVSSMLFGRQKVLLPIDPEKKQFGYMIYMLDTSMKSIAQILRNEHPFIMNTGNVYHSYYYDYTILRDSIQSKRITTKPITVVEAKKQRLVNYNLMKTELDMMKTPINLNTLHGRNFVYDLNPGMSLMKSQKKLTRVSRIERFNVYFNTLNYFLTKNYNMKENTPYRKGPILLDLDEYAGHEDIDEWHFLTMLLLLMRRKQGLMDRFKADYKILMYTQKGYILFDMNKDLQKINLNKLKMALKRLKPMVNYDKIDDDADKKEVALRLSMTMGLTGEVDDDDEEVIQLSKDDEIVNTVTTRIRNYEQELEHETKSLQIKSDPEPTTPSDEIPEDTDESEKEPSSDPEEELEDEELDELNKIAKEMEDDPTLKKQYVNSVTRNKTGAKSEASLKRDALLREKQMDIKIKDKTIGELKEQTDVPMIKERQITEPISTNQNINKVKFAKFEETYDKEVLPRDIANAITCFNDKTINVNVIDVKVEDTSDNMTLKDTYTITFEDEFRKRHTMKINVPKLIDDKFLYVNGSRKTIQKQFAGLPVIKTAPDTVQICTNYNKVFIYRAGSKFNPNIEKFKKFINDPVNGVGVIRGDNSKANEGELTCLEYDELAAGYNQITIHNCVFMFNVEALQEILGDKYVATLDRLTIGYKKKGNIKEPIFYEKNNDTNVDLISTMMLYAAPEKYDEFKSLSAGKKYIYTWCKILRVPMPTVVLLCFFEGLSTVIRKMNDKNIRFTDKADRKDNYMYIPFKDGYLSYPMSDMDACILLNGFTQVETKQFTIAQMDTRDAYLDIFEFLYGSAYIAGGLINYYDFMIDPITLEILQMLHYPEDIVSLFIYANNLLADNQFKNDINLSMYRLRDNEIIPALLYKEMTVAYSRYRNSANNNTQVKLSMDPDALIKELVKLPTVEDYSQLSPVVEMKQQSIASMKGYAGMNNDRSYTQDKRTFDESMLGVIGVSTDIAGNCGKERHLVLEPSVVNARGMIEIVDPKDIDKLKDVNLETGVEMITPSGVLHDDPCRTAMASKQSGHAIPVAKQSPLLVSNGFDSTIQYRTSNDFSVVAKEAGKVVALDEKNQIMIVEYKSGEKQAIDLANKVMKNGGGGMYLDNHLTTTFKEGSSFKKDAILAFDPKYYKDTGVLGNKLTFGTLVKSAVVSNYATYEDSTWVTKKLSEDMAAEVTMKIPVMIGKNSNVDFIVKPGDFVKIGEDLIRFETSYDDKEMSDLLSSIRDDTKEEIINLGKSQVTSKYTGVVSDVIVYPTIPLDQMTPSLAKVVKSCQKGEKDRKKLMDQYDKENTNSVYRMGVLFNKPGDIVETDRYGKIKGQDAEDRVLFEFYVTYHDELSDGDKLTHMTANKATVGYVIPKGYEPYTAFRPYEEISIPVAPSAILQRGTPSILPTMLNYKALIEVKRKMYEILTGESWNDKMKKENTYMLKPGSSKVSVSESTELLVSEIRDLGSMFGLYLGSDGYCHSEKIFESGDIIFACDACEAESYGAVIEQLGIRKDIQMSNVKYDSNLNAIVATELIMDNQRLFSE